MITGVVARVRVADLDAALPFYEAVTGATANRFGFAGAQLAAVGPFLLFAASGEVGDRLANVVATLTVDDVTGECERATALGATVLGPSTPTPNGHRAVVRYPDGSVVEYVGR